MNFREPFTLFAGTPLDERFYLAKVGMARYVDRLTAHQLDQTSTEIIASSGLGSISFTPIVTIAGATRTLARRQGDRILLSCSVAWHGNATMWEVQPGDWGTSPSREVTGIVDSKRLRIVREGKLEEASILSAQLCLDVLYVQKVLGEMAERERVFHEELPAIAGMMLENRRKGIRNIPDLESIAA